MSFDTKQKARKWVWSRLEDEGIARFPFPVEGRIPNFANAQKAAKRLAEHPLFEEAQIIKINPDSPQQPVRELALRQGKTVVVPTPRLKAGFMRFDPSAIDDEDLRDATMISRWKPFAKEVPLEAMPASDLIVTGCVAVTERGARAGKGHGYSDLEYAILQELGHDPVPVVTTVHDEQIVDGFPTEDHDLFLRAIFSPTRSIDVDDVGPGPDGIDWSLLDGDDLDEMPVLADLKARIGDSDQ